MSLSIGHLLSCKHASRLLSREQERPLTPLVRALLRLHLSACDGCTRFRLQLVTLRAAMRAYRS